MQTPPAAPVGSVEPSSPGRLTWANKIAYGIGGVTNQFGTNTVKTLAVPFFQMTLNVNPALLGLAMAIPRIWDAITDPLMGHLSDQTKSRFGRRKPYIVLGALLSGLAYIVIWHVPVNWSANAQVGWYLAASLLFFTFQTMWAVPYTSLGYEITPNYDERTTVVGVTTFTTQLSQLTSPWIFPLAQLALFSSVIQGMHVITAVIGIGLIAGVGMIPGLFVKERFATVEQLRQRDDPNRPGMLVTFRQVFRNRNMKVLMGLQLAGAISSIFASGLDYYVIVYYMCDGDIARGSTWKAILSTGFAFAGFLSVPLLVKASARFDKRNTLIAVYVVNLIGSAMAWFIFNPNHPWLILLNPVLCTHVYTATLIKQSMVADICDEDELLTSHRHEGAYGSLFGWVNKMAMSLSFLAAGIVLNLSGFDSILGGAQPEGTMTTIRLVLVIVPSLSSVVALGLLSYYRLDRQSAGAIRHTLEARRGSL